METLAAPVAPSTLFTNLFSWAAEFSIGSVARLP